MKGISFYKLLLLFYPKPYRKRFGEEMLWVFQETYTEELLTHGRVGLNFWVLHIFDIATSVLDQHIAMIEKYGWKKYFQKTLHVNRYNVIGMLLLLPFFSVFVIDFAARIIQRDLIHPNQYVLHSLYNTPLYWFPILFMWVLFFPLLAIFLNIISILKTLLKKHNRLKRWAFLDKNMLSVLLFVIGLACLGIFSLHDFAPCMIDGLLNKGMQQILPLINTCRMA